MLTTILRRTAIMTLLGALGFGAWKWEQLGYDPWEESGPRLEARLGEYADLRLRDDWAALYGMVDPGHRARVSLKSFLNFFDHDVLKTLELRPLAKKVDPITRTALVRMHTRGEFQPAKLPEQFRRGFRADGGAADYVNETEFDLGWTWVDGEWFFQLDREFLLGKDKAGAGITPLDEAAKNVVGGPR